MPPAKTGDCTDVSTSNEKSAPAKYVKKSYRENIIAKKSIESKAEKIQQLTMLQLLSKNLP